MNKRIHIFLSKLLPISHESGTNPKSVCDFTPVCFEIEPKSQNQYDFLNFNTYRKFWSIQKFLQNPLGIFSEEEENENNSFLFKDDEDPEEISNIKQKSEMNPKSLRFNKFFDNVFNILEIFASNPLQTTDCEGLVHLTVKRFPRFLTQSSLTETQFKDPGFRKIWLTQLLLAIHSLKNPIKIAPQKNYILLSDQVLSLYYHNSLKYTQIYSFFYQFYLFFAFL